MHMLSGDEPVSQSGEGRFGDDDYTGRKGIMKSGESQVYGTVVKMPALELDERVRREMTSRLNQLLADTITLRDLYKKCHWQVTGRTFYQLHLLFEKHFAEQMELVDAIAKRIQLLGGVCLAMGGDVAETMQIKRPPRGREEVPVQLSRLVDAHRIIIRDCRTLARRSSALNDNGASDLVVSQVLRTNERRVWFVSGHAVNAPLAEGRDPATNPGGQPKN